MSSQTKFSGLKFCRPFRVKNNKGSSEVQELIIKTITKEKFQKYVEQFQHFWAWPPRITILKDKTYLKYMY